jgi:hypothetical protein
VVSRRNNISYSKNNENYCFFRDVTSCSLLQVFRRFGGTYCLYIQGGTLRHGSSKQNPSCFVYSSSLKIEILCPSETSVNIWWTALSYIPEVGTVNFIHCHTISYNSFDSSLGLVTGCGLDGRSSIRGRGRDFCVLHSVQAGSGTYPAFCLLGIGGKTAGA